MVGRFNHLMFTSRLFLYLKKYVKSINKLIICKYCGDPIVFKENVISEKSYRQLPLNEFDGDIHRCTEGLQAWKQTRGDRKIFCKYCLEEEICFDDEHVTPSGKFIPLEKETGKIHDCPRRQFNPNTGNTITLMKGVSS
jgi:hypothetical protein